MNFVPLQDFDAKTKTNLLHSGRNQAAGTQVGWSVQQRSTTESAKPHFPFIAEFHRKNQKKMQIFVLAFLLNFSGFLILSRWIPRYPSINSSQACSSSHPAWEQGCLPKSVSDTAGTESENHGPRKARCYLTKRPVRPIFEGFLHVVPRSKAGDQPSKTSKQSRQTAGRTGQLFFTVIKTGSLETRWSLKG